VYPAIFGSLWKYPTKLELNTIAIGKITLRISFLNILIEKKLQPIFPNMRNTKVVIDQEVNISKPSHRNKECIGPCKRKTSE
jgi:hypothetical protein